MFLGLLRPVWSLLKTLILISLPVTLLPFLNGLIEGVFVGNYLIKTGYDNVRYLDQDLEARALSEFRFAIGSPQVTGVALAPFHVVLLQDPTQWWEKLGLERLDFDKEAYPPYGTPDANNFASLNGLHRPSDSEGEPWHHWVYASAQFWHIEGFLLDDWDKAFEELIQYRYANPSIASAGFHYIACPESFLCSSWRVNGPALLHFTTEVFETDKVKTEDQIPDYDAVTVRIIELPTQESLLPGVFPSHLNQLKAVTENSSWSDHSPHSEFGQFQRRYYEVCDSSERAYPQTYGQLAKLERSVLWTMSFEDSSSPKVARFIAVCLSGATRILGYRAFYKVLDLLGYNEPQQPQSQAEGQSDEDYITEQKKEILESLGDLGDEMKKTLATPEGTEAWNAMLDSMLKEKREKEQNKQE
ncbi:hypothetical protein G7Z17_g4544 [Cylindrodendrum hubeiense]|uniref:Uncharacterized protein n=1 Tax=Cylindrodendrum hubeiense TaxID=595255 RepID=A0A9P5H8P1_9HYPO|nr:hypothetical protein G7Z17_g4544 [Cylindrodendrum hubeiense]